MLLRAFHTPLKVILNSLICAILQITNNQFPVFSGLWFSIKTHAAINMHVCEALLNPVESSLGRSGSH